MTDMKNIKLIALDLDDTTLLSDSTLAAETRGALRAALGAGIEVVIASGRAFTALPREVTELEGIRYAVTSNGAAVEKLPSGERIVSFTLRPDTVRRIFEMFAGELTECFVGGRAYCDARYIEDPLGFGCSPEYVDYVKSTRLPVEDTAAFAAENIDRLDSVDVLCRTSGHRDELRARALTLENAYVTSSSPRLVEISDARAGKGASLRRLCGLLSVSPQEVAAFGNGDNDADMLRFAGLGVAVENATPACLAAADMVCPANNRHGVAETIYKILEGRA